MASWESVIRTRTELSDSERARLTALIREWSLPADLSFSDLVLFVRTWDAAGWFVAAHVRPSTASTALTDDPVGAFLPRSQALTLERAYQAGEPARGAGGRRVRLGNATLPDPMEAIPVPFEGAVIAVIARYSQIDQRRLGELEQQYLGAGDILFGMIGRGEFPLALAATLGGDAPRVGDGLLRLDADGVIRYSSPNARTALRRYGVPDPAPGHPLSEELMLAARRHEPPDADRLQIAAGVEAGEAEFASPAAVLTLRSLPLRDSGGAAGAVVLIRDVSDIRRQERALLSKDATIREIHHRVKNNLQTVGALLRLQARRMPGGEGRAALLDAVARVGTIALVHDSLSRSPGEDVDFDEISRRVLVMARDAAAAQETEAPQVVTEGSFGILPSAVATPLAMVFAEILLNAMEHSGATTVRVTAVRDTDTVRLIVADDGVGFDPTTVEGLGLQIVRTLVAEQLGGTFAIDSAPVSGHEKTPQGMVTEVTVSCGV
ncbi:MAG: sensor histidine kinase [Candidatus Nanopelagicales bacterium]